MRFSQIFRFFTVAVAMIALSGIAYAGPTMKIVESDIDPASLALDESKFLGQKLGDEKFTFLDDNGQEFTLGESNGKSRILLLSYYTCDGACPAINVELSELLQEVEKLGRMTFDKDYTVITLSFDKNDNPMTAKHFRGMIDLPEFMGEKWKMGVFKDHEDIKKFTSSIGYKFFWSPMDRMFYHPNAFIFLSPEGRIVRVMHSLNVTPTDMELALIDTNFNRLQPNQIITMAISFCYSYNYKEGKYGLNYPLFFAVGSLMLGLGAFSYGVFFIKRKEKKAKEITI